MSRLHPEASKTSSKRKRNGDGVTGRRGDGVTGRRGDTETGGWRDAETGGWGDAETMCRATLKSFFIDLASTRLLFTVSPHPRVPVSPCPLSPVPSPSPFLHFNVRHFLRIQALHKLDNFRMLKLGIVCFDNKKESIARCERKVGSIEYRVVGLR